MEQHQLDRETFSSSICLDLLKDPVTTSCGDSYCMNCIKNFWDDGEKEKSYCPQCKMTFTQRLVLKENTMLAALVEQLKKIGLQADPCYAGPEDVACDFCTPQRRGKIQQMIQSREEDVKLLQWEVEAINRSADKTAEDSEKIFPQLIRLLQKRSSEVKQQIRSQQETQVSRVKDVQEKLEQEITELKRKDAKLEQLSHTQDHNQFLFNYPSLPEPSESTHSSSINIHPLRHFEDVTAAV